MAEVDRTFLGMDFQEGLAHWGPVQDWLEGYVRAAAGPARSELAAHRHEGHSFIEVEHGDIDWHLVLNDERGLRAAMSIEFGRGPDENGKGASDGLFILHKAMGAPVKVQRPRSKRRKKITPKKRR